MQTVGVIGLGNMGSGIALNLIKNGFHTIGFDRNDHKMQALADAGGHPAKDMAELGKNADAVFVMVMNGEQAKAVILGAGGLIHHMPRGSVIILTATILPHDAQDIGAALDGAGISFVDCPVSGGAPGAQGGTLTLMAAAPNDVMDKFAPVLQAISSVIHHVGTQPGQGQSVKVCLQSLIGSIFSATYEASVLAAKAGVSGEALRNVIASTGAGNALTDGSLAHIIARKFDGTGSHINTMHKDLSIVTDVARDMGVPMHMAGAAMQLFTAGRAAYPDGDNQSVARVIENIVGAELTP